MNAVLNDLFPTHVIVPYVLTYTNLSGNSFGNLRCYPKKLFPEIPWKFASSLENPLRKYLGNLRSETETCTPATTHVSEAKLTTVRFMRDRLYVEVSTVRGLATSRSPQNRSSLRGNGACAMMNENFLEFLWNFPGNFSEFPETFPEICKPVSGKCFRKFASGAKERFV